MNAARTEAMKTEFKINISDQSEVKDFMSIKNNIIKMENARYMNIDKKEYQHRKKALPTIQEVINNNKEDNV